MNLIFRLDSLLCGGPGSGCKGPNCGRPSKGGDEIPTVSIKGFHAKMDTLAGKAIKGVKNLNDMIPTVGAVSYYGTRYYWGVEENGKFMDKDIAFAQRKGVELIRNAAKACGLTELQIQKNLFNQTSLHKDQQWNHGPGYYNAVKNIVKGKTPKDPYSMLIAVRAAITRAGLRKEYGDTVPLYRGLHGKYADDLVNSLKEKGEAKIKTRPAESWSLDKNISKQFALKGGLGIPQKLKSENSVIIHQDIPVENCIASQKTGFKMAFSEREVSVANPEKKWTLRPEDISIYSTKLKSLVKKYGAGL